MSAHHEWSGTLQLLEAATKDGCWPLALLEIDKLLPRTAPDLASVRTRSLWLQDPAAKALVLGCSTSITSSSSSGSLLLAPGGTDAGITVFVGDRLAARAATDALQVLQQCGPMNEGSGGAADVLDGLLSLQPVAIQLYMDGHLARCQNQQQSGCQLLQLRPGTPYTMRIELINKYGMVIAEHPPLSVEMSVGPEQLASLSSNPRAEMVRGRAEFERVELEGWAGANYSLSLRLIQAISPGGADSITDLTQQYSLWRDTRSAGVAASSSLSDSRAFLAARLSCSLCPSYAICLGGPVLAPSPTNASMGGVDYMQRQCAPGYQGRLCATCVSGMYLNNDYECRSCPSKAANITLGLLGFFASVALILYTTWTTLWEDHTADGGEQEVSASEKLKVLITHMQYLVIITRLNLGWPRVIYKAQSALGSLTGAGNIFAFSPSCMFDDPSSELRASSVVFGGLVLPISAAAVVMALWSLRAKAKLPSLRPAGPQSSVVQMDKYMNLPQQVLLVLLIALFVLYPSLVQVSLSMFACRVLDDGTGPYGSLEQATWKYGYWLHDLNVECYTGLHASLYLPLGIVCTVVFCVAPPLAVLATTMHHRATRHQEKTKALYGFLYRKYKDKFFWWEAVMQLQALCLVAVDVFARAMLEYQQALLLLAVLTVIGMINMITAAAHAELIRVMEFASLGVLSLTITLGLYFVDTGNSDTELDNPVAEDAVGLIILILNVVLVVVYTLMLLPSRVRVRASRLLKGCHKGSNSSGKDVAATAGGPSPPPPHQQDASATRLAAATAASAAGSLGSRSSAGQHSSIGHQLEVGSGPPSVGSTAATPVYSTAGTRGLCPAANKGAHSSSSIGWGAQAAVAAGRAESALQIGVRESAAADSWAADEVGQDHMRTGSQAGNAAAGLSEVTIQLHPADGY
ncbi:hypothetical protein HYH02_004357 [Chlamydomonas schloesseri]|uniref:TRP C-terminal domain-containing protein n=1 Tax=Chlamydomonas schloesseri TaxID=2026947 RepID=A0A836B9D2_9CHLO|nr:hypothetical protein HYH02_004357 [Chlamydomonas schloesseri]|eukprot:KAG2451089.1 hypothetical protein HYH02_004357 [Chlamydomonas schloesseri]